MMDKYEQIVAAAEYAVAVLCNPDTNDVQFTEIATVPAETAQTYAARGLEFVGVIGLINGVPRTALDFDVIEPDPEAMTFLAQSFIAYMKKQMRWTARPDLNLN